MLHVMYLNKEGIFFYFCEMNTLFKALSIDTKQCTVGKIIENTPYILIFKWFQKKRKIAIQLKVIF